MASRGNSLFSLIRRVKGAEQEPLRAKLEAMFLKKTREKRVDHDLDGVDVWHPSDVAYSICPRQRVLDRVAPALAGVDPPFSTNSQRNFEIGHAVHKWYQDKLLGPMGVLYGRWQCGLDSEGRPVLTEGYWPGKDWSYVEPLVRSSRYNLGGHIDGLLNLDGRWVLLDIKTCNSFKFREFRNSPPQHHLLQLLLYMLSTPILRATKQGLFGDNTPRFSEGILLYINKEDGREREFAVTYDQETVQPLLNDLTTVNEALARKLLPRINPACIDDAEYAKGCRSCELCFDLGKGALGYVLAEKLQAKAESGA